MAAGACEHAERGPWLTGRAGRRKGLLSVLSWRISFFTMRSICGCKGNIRPSRFERYADDAICHCASEAQALELRQALDQRFATCQLRLHPEKTKIVYCKDANRPGEYPERSFNFLGYTFRSRVAVGRGQKRFVSFIPAVSDKAAKRMRLEVRRWRLHMRTDLELDEIARVDVRPYPLRMGALLRAVLPLEASRRNSARSMLSSCVGCTRKYKRFRGRTRWRAWDWLRSLQAAQPKLCLPTGPWDQRLDDGSRMNREVHVRFWESAGL